ncbi:MAG: hypothetical protein ACYCWW_13870, partial [Deltaproteobacteria bacterium]
MAGVPNSPELLPLSGPDVDPTAATDPSFHPPWLATPTGLWANRRARVAACIVAGLALVPLALSALLALPPIRSALSERARRAVLERLPGTELHGEVRVGLFGVELHGLRYPGPAPEDPPTLSAELAVVRPDLWALLAGHVRPKGIELRWVRVHPGARGSALKELARRVASRRHVAPPAAGGRPRDEAAPEVRLRDLYVDMPTLDSEGWATLGPLSMRVDWHQSSERAGQVTLRVEGGLLDGRGGRFSLRGTHAHETGAGDIALSLERIHVADLPPGWLGDRGIALPAGTLDGQ